MTDKTFNKKPMLAGKEVEQKTAKVSADHNVPLNDRVDQQFFGHGVMGLFEDDEFERCENPLFKNYCGTPQFPNTSAYLSDYKCPWTFKKLWVCYRHKYLSDLYAFAKEFTYRNFSLTMVFYRWEDVPLFNNDLSDISIRIWRSGPDGKKTLSTDICEHGAQFEKIVDIARWLEKHGRISFPEGLSLQLSNVQSNQCDSTQQQTKAEQKQPIEWLISNRKCNEWMDDDTCAIGQNGRKCTYATCEVKVVSPTTSDTHLGDSPQQQTEIARLKAEVAEYKAALKGHTTLEHCHGEKIKGDDGKEYDDVPCVSHMAYKELEAEVERLTKEYEGPDKRWHSFETVQAIVKERDSLKAENERLKEVIDKMGDDISSREDSSPLDDFKPMFKNKPESATHQLAREAYEQEAKTEGAKAFLKSIPIGTGYKADRYDTEKEMILHVWKDAEIFNLCTTTINAIHDESKDKEPPSRKLTNVQSN